MIVGFAGAGSIAGAIARGWATAGDGPEGMVFADAGSGRAAELAEQVGGGVAGSLAELAAASDLVVLAFKPAQLAEAAAELREQIPAALSVLAATSLERLRAELPGTPVVRAMPTVVVEIHQAVICHAPLEAADGEAGRETLRLLALLGRTVEVPDELIDAATAVIGCSPAYVALVAEAIAAAGAAAGLEPRLAKELVCDTFAGTAELLRDRDPAELRRAIASPGGGTEAGLEALAAAEAAEAFGEAVRASLRRMGR